MEKAWVPVGSDGHLVDGDAMAFYLGCHELDCYDVVTYRQGVPPKVGYADVFCGSVSDVRSVWRSLGIKEPEPIDYPPSLQQVCYLRRGLLKMTIGELRRNGFPYWRNFVKPVRTKQFDSLGAGLWGVSNDRDEEGRRAIDKLASFSAETECWVSPHTMIQAERRFFVHNKRIVGETLYRCDYAVSCFLPFDYELIRKARDEFEASGEAPVAYTLDFGVHNHEIDRRTRNDTLLVEVNDAYSLGSYGLAPVTYAKMLIDRWHQIVN